MAVGKRKIFPSRPHLVDCCLQSRVGRGDAELRFDGRFSSDTWNDDTE